MLRLARALLTLAIGMGVAGPVAAQIIGTAPCCTTPAIIEELRSRPAGESREQLVTWVNRRFEGQIADAADLDIQALTGACEADCPASYRTALATLRQLRGLDVDLDTHGEPCCTGSAAPAGRGVRPSPPRAAAQQARAMTAQVDALYTDSIIRRIVESPGDVALWLPDYLKSIRLRRVELLFYRLAGQCPGQRCTPALATGLEIARERLQESEQEARRLREAQAQLADAAAQESGRQTAILLTVIASIVTLIGVLITLLWSGRQSRKHARSLEAWLGKLDDRLGILASRRQRRSSPSSGRGAVRIVRGQAKSKK
jgi:hypothetical protein